MATNVPTQTQLAQMNAAQTAALLATGTEYFIKGTPVSTALGEQINLPMPNAGIMIGCDLRVSLPIDVTAAMTANSIGGLGTITNVQTSDWYGNTRHNTSASRLDSFVSYQLGRLYNHPPASLKNAGAGDLDSLPTATGKGTISFQLHVPFVRDGSLDGALLTQTSNGTCFVTLQTLADSAMVSSTNPDAPYSAGTATFSDITVTPYWRYIMPVNFDVAQLPILSLSTAFAIQDQISQSNLVANQQNLMNFAAARKIYALMIDFINGDERNFGSDVSELQIIVNGATPVQTYSANAKLVQQRNRLGADDLAGRYYFGFGAMPINTMVFGSYQTALTPSVVNSGAKQVLTQKMTYAMGQPLPGLAV